MTSDNKDIFLKYKYLVKLRNLSSLSNRGRYTEYNIHIYLYKIVFIMRDVEIQNFLQYNYSQQC